ncbi:hypothetical protein [Fibrivirga algicola]|uniref:Uncharacterized protein n=1 Tax=Fibrivirga algicola TaxID=2950420 RepID=A0ABX0QE73_9BACT|nr:hypothetical protein [Fibrivirga algicola]NID10208.1 hypothetical protein [Fibrivirga algicola]
MKQLFTLSILCFLLSIGVSVAQKSDGPIYAAKVRTSPSAANKRRDDEITRQAKEKLNDLVELLNMLTSSITLSELERKSLIKNSFLPNPNQLFYNDAVVIEDDIDPTHTSIDSTVEMSVERYLTNLELYYAKTDSASIDFSQKVTSRVYEGRDYPYIKIFFKSLFKSKHNELKTPYTSGLRVAEIRADSVDGKIHTFITRLGFQRPTDNLSELTAPMIHDEVKPKKSIKGQETFYLSSENRPDSLVTKFDSKWLHVINSSTLSIPMGFYQRSAKSGQNQSNVSIMLRDNNRRLTFRRIDGTSTDFNKIIRVESVEELVKRKRKLKRWGWAQTLTGVIALGASYTGYSSLQTSYNDYSDRLTTVNAEYAMWSSLSQQSGSTPSPLMAFNEYAKPGIYGVYGGTVVGSTLLVNGIRCLLKAGRIKIPTKK